MATVVVALSLGVATTYDWASSRLATHGLRVANFAVGGRGLATTQDRSAGQTIIEIQNEDVFSTSQLLPLHPVLFASAKRELAAGRPLTDEHLLPLLLLLSRAEGAAGEWSDFIGALPQMQPSALTARSEELALLPPCYAAMASAVNAYAHSLHAQCSRAIDDLEASGMERSLFSPEAFQWAHGHVGARKLGFGGAPCAGVKEVPAGVHGAGVHGSMLPVLDLINHSPDARQHVEKCEGSWKVVSSVPYEAGEQMFFDYGHRGNLRLWTQYGFATDDSALAAFDIDEVTLAVESALAPKQEDVVRKWREWVDRDFVEVEFAAETGPEGCPNVFDWMQSYLFFLDLTDGRASDKLNEALIAAVGIADEQGGRSGSGGHVDGVASHNERTDEIIAHLLRARLEVLSGKLDECAKWQGDESERIEPLRVLMATEAKAAEKVLGEIEARREETRDV